MDAEKEILVKYQRQGDDRHSLFMGSEGLPNISIDYTGIPQDQRGGTASRLLCASALYCFASTLGSALTARGAKIRSLSGRAVLEKGRDDYYRPKVSRIRIEMDVDVADADLPVLEKCKSVMEHGCLVTYSLEEGIEVEHIIRRSEEGQRA